MAMINISEEMFLPTTPISSEEVAAILNETMTDVNSTSTLKHRDIWSESAATGLIAALIFGIIFFVTVLVLVGKRCYDGWQRRHYSKIDYLINGMYN